MEKDQGGGNYFSRSGGYWGSYTPPSPPAIVRISEGVININRYRICSTNYFT